MDWESLVDWSSLRDIRVDLDRLPRQKQRARSGMAAAPRPIARFPSPEGLCWEEVGIVFVSNDAVRVTARGISKVFTFAELGFKDSRKGDRPDTRWAVLRELARHGGEVGWNSNAPAHVKSHLKTAIKDIRKRLQAVMQLDDDPFHPYRQRRAYVARFELRDESYSAADGEIGPE